MAGVGCQQKFLLSTMTPRTRVTSVGVNCICYAYRSAIQSCALDIAAQSRSIKKEAEPPSIWMCGPASESTIPPKAIPEY